jgi:hypothetical protein
MLMQSVTPQASSLQAESAIDSSGKRISRSGSAAVYVHNPHSRSYCDTSVSVLDQAQHRSDSARNVRDELEHVLDRLHDTHERFSDRFSVQNHFFRRTGGQGIVQVWTLLMCDCESAWCSRCMEGLPIPRAPDYADLFFEDLMALPPLPSPAPSRFWM